MKFTARVVPVVAIVLVLAAFACSPAGRATDVPDAQREQDLAALAQGLGISLDEARQRQDMRDAAQGLYDAVYADSDHFAGAFQTDGDGKWRIVVLVVGVDGPPDSIKSLVPQGVPVDFVSVDYSFAQLKQIHGEVVEFWKSVDPQLTAIEGINLDTIANRVVVEFADKDNPELRAKFSTAFGPIVTFRIVPSASDVSCDHLTDYWEESRYNCTEIRGGIRIDPGIWCTLSPGAWNVSGGRRAHVTAGHCGSYLANVDMYHNNVLLGTSQSVNDSLTRGPSVDSDARYWDSPYGTGQWNRVYLSPGTTSYSITADSGFGGRHVHDPICVSGVGGHWAPGGDISPYQCGTLSSELTTYTTDSGQVLDVMQCDCNGDSYSGSGLLGGDSGAPIFWSSVLYGIGTDSSGKFSTADSIEADLQIRWCHNSDCSSH